MNKKSLLCVTTLALLAPYCAYATDTSSQATRNLITATLTYGLTNNRTLLNQKAFDRAFEQAQDNLNTPVMPDSHVTDAMGNQESTITPLMAATYALSYYMILKLIAAGADPEITGSNGFNSYDWVKSRTWIHRLLPNFEKELDAVLALRPETEDQKEFVATLTEIYRLLEPLLKQRVRGFYNEPKRFGVIQYFRSHHERYMHTASGLLLKTQEPDCDYKALAQLAHQLLKAVQAIE